MSNQIGTTKLGIAALVLAAIVPVVKADTSVGGNADLAAQVQNVGSLSVGAAATSTVSVSSIESSRVGGNAQIKVVQGNILGLAIGGKVTNEISVGRVKNSRVGSVDVGVVTGNVLSITAGIARKGTVQVGTVTNASVGSVGNCCHGLSRGSLHMPKNRKK